MSLNTTNPVTSSTLTSNTGDSTQSSLFTTIVDNSTTSYSTATTYPYGDINITWVIPTLPPTIYVPTIVDTGFYYSTSLYSLVIVFVILGVLGLASKLAIQRRRALAGAAVRQRNQGNCVTCSTFINTGIACIRNSTVTVTIRFESLL